MWISNFPTAYYVSHPPYPPLFNRLKNITWRVTCAGAPCVGLVLSTHISRPRSRWKHFQFTLKLQLQNSELWNIHFKSFVDICLEQNTAPVDTNTRYGLLLNKSRKKRNFTTFLTLEASSLLSPHSVTCLDKELQDGRLCLHDSWRLSKQTCNDGPIDLLLFCFQRTVASPVFMFPIEPCNCAHKSRHSTGEISYFCLYFMLVSSQFHRHGNPASNEKTELLWTANWNESRGTLLWSLNKPPWRLVGGTQKNDETSG